MGRIPHETGGSAHFTTSGSVRLTQRSFALTRSPRAPPQIESHCRRERAALLSPLCLSEMCGPGWLVALPAPSRAAV